jgi:hypothetical protein
MKSSDETQPWNMAKGRVFCAPLIHVAGVERHVKGRADGASLYQRGIVGATKNR